MGESGPSAGYTGAAPAPGSFGSGAGGPQAGWDPNAMMQTWQGYTPEQQQPWLSAYGAADPGQQQGWLDFLGQSDPTGGVNNPNYVPPAPVASPPPSHYPSTSPGVPTNTWTPDPVDPPGTPAPPPAPTTAEGGNPWDDLTSPRFQRWFTEQLAGGQSPGLNFTGGDAGSQYGTYNTRAEQAALMAQFNALPPEVQAAYVAEYMKRTPEEQALWRNAFGADNGPDLGNAPGTYTGDQSLSNAGRPADATSNMWYPDPEIARYYMGGQQSPAWTRAYGQDGTGGELGGWGPQGEWRWAGGKRPAAGFPG